MKRVIMERTLLKSALSSTAIFALLASAPSYAQDAEDTEYSRLEEIVVTADRRERDVQSVPISVNAFSARAIEKQRIQDFGDLAIAIPGFSINSFSKSRLNPSLRGGSSSLTAAGAEGAVGLFIDDQYYGGPGDFEIDLFDVERIEVLRGPQGTLFGRNTTGGSINVVTKKPTEENEGKIEVTYGNYNLVQIKGLVNGKISDNLFGLLTFASTSRDGTSFNSFTGNDIDNINKSSIRGKLRWIAADDLEVTLSASFTKHDETGNARDAIFLDQPTTQTDLVAQGFVPDNEPRVVQQHTDGRYQSEQFTAGLRIEKDFDNGQLMSITSFRNLDTNEAKGSLAGAPYPLFSFGEPREATTFSEEIRYLSDFDGPLNFVGGLFFYHADEGRVINTTTNWDENTVGGSFQAITFCDTQTGADFDNYTISPSCFGSDPLTVGNVTRTLDSLYSPNDFSVFENVKTTSYAAFAEATYAVTDRLSLIAGARWTYDKKSMVGGSDGDPDFFWNPQPGLRVADSANWNKVTWRFGATFNVNDDVMLYGTASKGFRAGAYEVSQSDPNLSDAPVDPETVVSYEGGMKSRWADDRIQFNITYFNAKYSNLQFFVNTGASSITTNAGEATINGIEADLYVAITPELNARFQWSHQNGSSSGIPADAEIAEGTPPQGTIPNTYIVGLEYEKTLDNGNVFSASIDFTKKDRYGLEFNDVPQFQSEVRSLVNARMDYEFGDDGQWNLSAWAKNITNENIVIYGQDFWFTFYDTASYLENPDVIEQTAQPRYADPATYGLSLSYSF